MLMKKKMMILIGAFIMIARLDALAVVVATAAVGVWVGDGCGGGSGSGADDI